MGGSFGFWERLRVESHSEGILMLLMDRGVLGIRDI